MANKHYSLDEEIELTLKVKVKLKNISNYHPLNQEDIDFQINEFKSEISEHLLRDKLVNEYQQEEVTDGVDWWNYEVVKAK